MSEPLRIVSVINEDQNTPDFVSRVRVGVLRSRRRESGRTSPAWLVASARHAFVRAMTVTRETSRVQ